MRSHRSGPYSADEQALFRSLTTHIRRAVDIHRRVHDANVIQEAICAGLERIGLAVAIVDQRCRLIFANSAAEEVFCRCIGLTVRSGHLTATNPNDETILLARVFEALRPDLQQSHRRGILFIFGDTTGSRFRY